MLFSFLGRGSSHRSCLRSQLAHSPSVPCSSAVLDSFVRAPVTLCTPNLSLSPPPSSAYPTLPAGVLVITDSNQLGDRPSGDAGLGKFEKFNEPNYGTYICLDMGAMFMEQGGLQPWRKDVASASKVLAFKKPMVAGGDGGWAAPEEPAAAAEVPSAVLSDAEVSRVVAAASSLTSATAEMEGASASASSDAEVVPAAAAEEEPSAEAVVPETKAPKRSSGRKSDA